ncbi:COMPASS complex subunit Sdc1 [Aspergillus flavus AF70]|nr:COMPASS complex subunit Sdc1 [Aspergillus flavus AF70]
MDQTMADAPSPIPPPNTKDTPSTTEKQSIMANDSNPNTAAANTPTGEPTPTTQLRPGGAPARVYMNEKIVPYLLEGMKHVTKEQPQNPLRVLGEFLIQKSNEVEGAKSPE